MLPLQGQSLKNSTCATQWSVPCPSLHQSKAPIHLTKGRQVMPHLPMCAGHLCTLDLFTSSFPMHLPVHDHITLLFYTTSYPMHLSRWSFFFQRQQPSYSCSMASPPPVTVGLWQKSSAFLSMWRKQHTD